MISTHVIARSNSFVRDKDTFYHGLMGVAMHISSHGFSYQTQYFFFSNSESKRTNSFLFKIHVT